MKRYIWVIAALAMAITVPNSAVAKEKKHAPRGMIESMQSLPCGVKQKGLTGLGSVWGSIGVTSVNSNEKLCPQYLLRTDDMEYHIRPTDTKHAVLLPVGHEAEFKIKKDRLFLKVPEGSDKKTRTYQVVSMEQLNSASQAAAYHHSETRPDKSPDYRPLDDQSSSRVANQNTTPNPPNNVVTHNPLPPQ